MPDTVDSLASLVRFIADDPEIASLSTSLLEAPINAGYREWQRRAALARVPVVLNTVEIDLPANTLTLGPATTPPLPDDFLMPYTMEERVTGSNSFWCPVEEKNWPRETIQGDFLFRWLFEGDAIHFLGATQPITIRLHYAKTLPVLLLPDDPLPVWAIDGIAWCVLYAIALARGMPDAYRDRCSQMAEQQMAQMQSLYVKRDQFQNRKRPVNYESWRY